MKHFLVVVDMQRDFVNGSLGTAEADAMIPQAVEKIRSFDGDIFVTYDTHFADYLESQDYQSTGRKTRHICSEVYIRVRRTAGPDSRQSRRRRFFHRTDRPLHGHLCHQQCTDSEGKIPGKAHFRGCTLLCRRNAGAARSRAVGHAELPDRYCEITGRN